jgi:hypothetical protein
VDYDAERLCIVFSRSDVALSHELEGMGASDARLAKESSKTEAVRKLREQALPAQIRLLQNYGKRHPILNEVAQEKEAYLRRMSIQELRGHAAAFGSICEDSLEKDDLVKCLLDKNEMIGRVLGETFVNATDESPACVCGSSLVRVSGPERTMRCCDKMPPLAGVPRNSPNYRVVYERLTATQTSICFCDLCGDSVPTANAVWTCKNGDTTILHATSYDVCDECFMKYAALDEPMTAMDTDTDGS